MENFVYSPEIVLPSGSQVDADFMVRGAIIDYDEFPNVDYWGLQVSPDGGVNWYYISNPYGDPNGDNYVYTDTPEMWVSFNEINTTPIDLDNYAGKTIQFRWFFHSDGDAVPTEAEGLWLDDIVVNVDGSEVYYEDFEDGTMSGWISEDQTATPAMWHQSTVNAYDGQSWRMADPSIGTNGGYADHWYQVLDTPNITLPTSGDMVLSFMQQRAIEGLCTSSDPDICPYCVGQVNYDGWDAFNVRISNDGGASWEVLTPSSPQYNTDVTYSFGFEFDEGCDIPGWGGPETNPSWTSTTVPIPSSYYGEEVMIRFAFASDGYYSTTIIPNLTGVWIDKIDIAGVFTNDGEDAAGFNAQSLVTVGGDLWHVAYTAEEPQYPSPANLVAVAGDQLVSLSWDPIGGSEGGEIVYDNDDGSGSLFTSGIFTEGGTFVAGEYFDTPFGAEVTAVKIFGYSSNTRSSTTVSGYTATGGSISSSATFQTSVTLTAGVWNEIDLSGSPWSFAGDFVIGFEVGTFEEDSIIYAALDESAVPSTNSYADLDGWSTWQSIAQAINLPDGEWGIRAIIAASGEVSVVYNIYRHTMGQDYGDPLSYGSAWPDNTFDDPFVMNGTTYWYVVTAVYNYGNEDEAESPFSDEVEVTPEAETVYELSYDDGTAETGVTPLGDGGFYAVRFTPDDYPIQILKVKYYATGAGGLTWVKLFKDDGENGMPGTQLGTDLLFTSIIEGWNEKDVSAGNISVDGGSFYVGWGESEMSTQLGLDTDAPIEGNSYFQIPGDPWAPISDLGGYNGDLMIRVVVDAVASITPMQLSQLPSMFSLKQNYPNPFNPITFIPFELPKDTHVSLQIYDLKGRVVRELVSEWLPAGQYQYPLNGSDLATGIYIYRLLAGDFTMTKKMILLK